VSAQLAPNSFSASLLIGRPKPMNSIVSAQLAPNSFSASLLIGRPKPEKPCCQRQGLSPFAIRGTEGRERLDLSRPSVPRMADPPPSDLGADTKKNHKNRLSRCDCLSRCSVYWVCVNDPFAGCYCKRPSFMSVVLYIGCALMIPFRAAFVVVITGAAPIRLQGRPLWMSGWSADRIFAYWPARLYLSGVYRWPLILPTPTLPVE